MKQDFGVFKCCYFLILCACSVINLLFYISLSNKSATELMLNGLPYSTVNKSSMLLLLLLYRRAPPFICQGTSLMTLSLWLFWCCIQINAGECSYLHVL